MSWFGFGYSGFEQLEHGVKLSADLPEPVRLPGNGPAEAKHIIKPVPSWSYSAILIADGSLLLNGFISGSPPKDLMLNDLGCVEVFPTEKYLLVQLKDQLQCWDTKTLSTEGSQAEPMWKMDLPPGHNLSFPLVANGYIIPKPPFLMEFPSKVCAHKLALGNEHAVLLTSNWTVLTWGAGRHGQLGHDELEDVLEPRIVDALNGVGMKEIAAGGWHSASISEGGDIYCWGWNESGQLGLPCRTLTLERGNSGKSHTANEMGDTFEFISIQAFPALIDLPKETEACKISCGSRHTAAVTCSGELYSWGWGKYGQLGHGDTHSQDQPLLVKYFSDNNLFVNDVICRNWNTYVFCLGS
ncbi:hypothetical protein GDO86_006382 [Hymenochirus boettgeri]|uniref:RCC1 domain-containing protein 1 n=1 Tax=Hymenochirus boettgeri TaxID=247094 RepID=A0A8T2J5W5_9PIPI|nr:hypothetical protein GDO86_006382 [Hymenochirus boettgeri]